MVVQTELWGRVNEYYQQILSKIIKVRKAALTPSKDISKREVILFAVYYQVEKSLGLSEHLFSFVLNQRSRLSDLFNSWSEFNADVELLNSTAVSKDLPPQNWAKKWIYYLKGVLDQFCEQMEEFSLLESVMPMKDSSLRDQLYVILNSAINNRVREQHLIFRTL